MPVFMLSMIGKAEESYGDALHKHTVTCDTKTPALLRQRKQDGRLGNTENYFKSYA